MIKLRAEKVNLLNVWPLVMVGSSDIFMNTFVLHTNKQTRIYFSLSSSISFSSSLNEVGLGYNGLELNLNLNLN